MSYINEAKSYFRKSIQNIRHPAGCYFLMVIYADVKSVKKAKYLADEALEDYTGKRMPRAFQKCAKRTSAWARKQIKIGEKTGEETLNSDDLNDSYIPDPPNNIIPSADSWEEWWK